MIGKHEEHEFKQYLEHIVKTGGILRKYIFLDVRTATIQRNFTYHMNMKIFVAEDLTESIGKKEERERHFLHKESSDSLRRRSLINVCLVLDVVVGLRIEYVSGGGYI